MLVKKHNKQFGKMFLTMGELYVTLLTIFLTRQPTAMVCLVWFIRSTQFIFYIKLLWVLLI